MPLNLEQKRAIVAEVSDVANSALLAIAAEYRGLTVEEMTALRREARNNGVYLRVVRNTLAKRAVENTDFACMQEGLTGPLILAFSQEVPSSAARVIKDFAKEHKFLEVKMVSIDGKMLAPGDIDALAKLPTYDQAISMLIAVMKAPVEKLARIMNEVPGKLVRTVAAIKDAKQAA
ncbi:MAG: 50S ribosomal protein L10 [Candidatus Thiodiazotropha sp. (ex Lucinoma aequizonata)]|nr:50S ribosomal protein L10 [Candidatus Thiodiazotropha sp. (ex Lucinoma aequizonata)]MCU7887619.1 50S ribosomal protein L10 [Candidatus Thiodiazotropha sp. (ex Lucinoma aequizonata)]MCU7894987.1 50S ribosomal protein L10 [Candidatus Thiodiazotropha sp. (ex Lucinoma aequizonata)]MCU7897348.1 50S ribosomal protein L10 [Candidatus Thiodiazotropha sp. (ex Lucinoma aequizonata)]MCU7902876.1 50S ribosomal protein L10 [Candidatus Thiodiazotropha sp. (ex Lucinoma aequizonata)]